MRSHATRPRLETVVVVCQLSIKNTAATLTKGFFEKLLLTAEHLWHVGLNLYLRTHSLKGWVQIKEVERESQTKPIAEVLCWVL